MKIINKQQKFRFFVNLEKISGRKTDSHKKQKDNSKPYKNNSQEPNSKNNRKAGFVMSKKRLLNRPISGTSLERKMVIIEALMT